MGEGWEGGRSDTLSHFTHSSPPHQTYTYSISNLRGRGQEGGNSSRLSASGCGARPVSLLSSSAEDSSTMAEDLGVHNVTGIEVRRGYSSCLAPLP